MEKDNTFEDLWTDHWKWAKGILLRELIEAPNVNIHLGYTTDNYYNFATPTISKPSDLNINIARKYLDNVNKSAGFYLLEKHQKQGFVEYLVRNGYKLYSRESWMLFEKENPQMERPNDNIIEVTPSTFSGFYEVLSAVFSDFEGNETYLDICKKTLSGETQGSIKDNAFKLYLIYEGNKPVSGSGLIYSKNLNVAYLHNTGTLKDHRGKGYQTDLIKHRVKVAMDNNITRIYSLVEHGEQSWSNLIKCGFSDLHTAYILVPKQ